MYRVGDGKKGAVKTTYSHKRIKRKDGRTVRRFELYSSFATKTHAVSKEKSQLFLRVVQTYSHRHPAT